MAISYATDIITGLYASKVGNDANYQIPGNFKIPAKFIETTAEKDVKTLIELIRAYVATISTKREAKLASDLLGKAAGTVAKYAGNAATTATATRAAMMRQYADGRRSAL